MTQTLDERAREASRALRAAAELRPRAAASQRTRPERRRRRHLATSALGCVVALAIIAAAVGALNRATSQTENVRTTSGLHPEPRAVSPSAYLDQVLTIVEDHAYFATPQMIQRWREQATGVASKSTTTADTYPFVQGVVRELDSNDPPRQGQSLWHPDRVAAYESRDPVHSEGVPSAEVDGSRGYINMPPITAVPTSTAGQAYIEAARRALSTPLCGWVLDLRAQVPDATSDVRTMLSAVAPLLGTGSTFGTRLNDGSETRYEIASDGSVLSLPDRSVVAPAFGKFTPARVPIAILQGPGTTNKFEQLLIAFVGKAEVRTFGESTAGQSVVRQDFPLEDGSLLWLATGVTVDRSDHAYDGPIAPDEPSRLDASARTDTARGAAETWLAQQTSCR